MINVTEKLQYTISSMLLRLLYDQHYQDTSIYDPCYCEPFIWFVRLRCVQLWLLFADVSSVELPLGTLLHLDLHFLRHCLTWWRFKCFVKLYVSVDLAVHILIRLRFFHLYWDITRERASHLDHLWLDHWAVRKYFYYTNVAKEFQVDLCYSTALHWSVFVSKIQIWSIFLYSLNINNVTTIYKSISVSQIQYNKPYWTVSNLANITGLCPT